MQASAIAPKTDLFQSQLKYASHGLLAELGATSKLFTLLNK